MGLALILGSDGGILRRGFGRPNWKALNIILKMCLAGGLLGDGCFSLENRAGASCVSEVVLVAMVRVVHVETEPAVWNGTWRFPAGVQGYVGVSCHARGAPTPLAGRSAPYATASARRSTFQCPPKRAWPRRIEFLSRSVSVPWAERVGLAFPGHKLVSFSIPLPRRTVQPTTSCSNMFLLSTSRRLANKCAVHGPAGWLRFRHPPAEWPESKRLKEPERPGL